MNMDNMDKYLEEVKSTGIFVCFCVSMELDRLDYINIRIPKCDRRQHKDVVIYLLIYFCVADIDLDEMRMYWIWILLLYD